MPPLNYGVAGSSSFNMQFYESCVYLFWDDNRPHETRPVHAGEDPQEVANNWKEEICT